MALPVQIRKHRGAASHLDVATHVCKEMAAKIERRKQNPEYEGSAQHKLDEKWLAVLLERTETNDGQDPKTRNPIKLSKRLK